MIDKNDFILYVGTLTPWQGLKTLLNSFLIHRIYIGINIKYRHNNLGLQNLKSMLNLSQWFTSAHLGLCPNKSFVRDCQNASFVLPVRCAAPQLKR